MAGRPPRRNAARRLLVCAPVVDTIATTLEAELRARLTPVEDIGVAERIGIEQEFVVRTRDLSPVDFRSVLPRLDGLHRNVDLLG